MTEQHAKEIADAANKLAEATTDLKRANENFRLASSESCRANNAVNSAAKELDTLIKRSKEMMPSGIDRSAS